MDFTYINPGTLLAPTPAVMVSVGCENENSNIITIAWAGIVNSDPPLLSVSVRPGRHSYHMIEKSQEFVINLVGRSLTKAADLCGVRSGRDMDKFSACGLHPLPVPSLRYAPAIQEAPLHLACKVQESKALGTHTMFIGRIVDVGVRNDLIDADGRIDYVKADLTAYCHGEYMTLDQPLGFFGYSIARPEVLARRMGASKSRKE